MKITDIYESTTSGAIATVAAPMTTQKRSGVGKGVYGNEKAGNLLTGKKTNKKYANSISESKMKQVASDLETMQDGNFKQKYGKTKDQIKMLLGDPRGGNKTVHEAELGEILNVKLSKRDPSKETKWNRDGWPLIKQPSAEAHLGAAEYHNEQANKWKAQFRDALKNPNLPEKGKEAYKWEIQRNNQEAKRHRLAAKNFNAVNEAHLEEDDLILVPGQGHKLKSGFIPHGESRLDHEVEMARSDLFSAAKNAKQVYELIRDLTEEEGLEGWVQEKIIKANDYLNTIREYLEGKQLQHNEMGVIAGGAGNFEEEAKGLWANIHAKRERIKKGSGERMRKPGSKGAPTAQNFRDAAK